MCSRESWFGLIVLLVFEVVGLCSFLFPEKVWRVTGIGENWLIKDPELNKGLLRAGGLVMSGVGLLLLLVVLINWSCE